MNLVVLAGRIGKDPETSYTQGGTAKTRFSLATSERFNDSSGQPKEITDWHNITVWGKRGEHVQKYLSKGSYVVVRGKIRTESWDDQKTGQKRYMTHIIADNVEFGPKSGGGGQREQHNERGYNDAPPSNSQNHAAGANSGMADDDDIPF